MQSENPDRNFFLRVAHRKRVAREYGQIIGHAGIAIYEQLCTHADSNTGKTFVGRRTICELVRVSPRTFGKLICLLADLRLITIEPGKGKVPTVYVILPLPESRNGVLPFDVPAVPQENRGAEVVVPKLPDCGSEEAGLRFPNDNRTKEELTDLSNRELKPLGTEAQPTATRFSLEDLAQLVIAGLQIPGSPLLLKALASAIRIEAVRADVPPPEAAEAIREACELYQATSGQRWTLLTFMQEAKYREDPINWSSYGKNGIDPGRNFAGAAERRAVHNVSAAVRAIQLDREDRARRAAGINHGRADPPRGAN